MSDPENRNRPEGEQPTEQPTQQYGEQPTEQFGEQVHTTDPNAAYGQGYQPTQQLPPYDPRFDPYAPPPNPTKAYPVQGGQHPGYAGYPAAGYPPPGGYPPDGGYPPPEDQEPDGPRRWPLVVAGLAVVGLLVVGGGILLGSGGGSDETAAPALPTLTTRPPAPTTTPPPATTDEPAPTAPGESPFAPLPGGLGEALGDLGAAVGTLTSNDGSTLVIDTTGGSQLTIETTAQTQVIGFGAQEVADLSPGSTLIVQGSPVEGGRMTADMILAG